MEVSDNQLMEFDSEEVLKRMLPREWIVRKISKDFGIDYEIEIVNRCRDKNILSGNRLWVQLKSTRSNPIRTKKFRINGGLAVSPSGRGEISVNYVGFALQTKYIEYALQCAFPLLLVVVDMETQELYWVPVRNDLEVRLSQENPDWSSQSSATIQIPTWNTFSRERGNDYEGLRWFACEPARMIAFSILNSYYHECFPDIVERKSHCFFDFKRLNRDLRFAHGCLKRALAIDILFGANGVDYFVADTEPDTFSAPCARTVISHGVFILEMILNNQVEFPSCDMRYFHEVQSAVRMLSRVGWMYDGFKQKYILTEATAVWYGAGTNGNAPPRWPIRNPYDRQLE